MGTVRQLLAALVLVLAANASLGDAAAIRRTVSGPEHHHQHGHSAHIMNKRAVAATEAEAADAYGNAGRPVSGTQVSSNGFGFDAVGNLLGYASSTSNGHTDTSLNFADVLGNGGSAAILGFTQGLSADRSARGQPTLDAHQSAVGSGGNAIVNVLGVGDQSSRGHTSTASSFIDGVGVAGGSSALGATQHINVTPETSTGHSGPLYRRAEADYDAYGEYEASTPLYRRQLKGRPTRSKKLVVLKIPKVKLHRRSAYETKPRRKKVNVVFADDLFPKDEPSDTSAATAPDMMPDTAAPEATSSASEAAVPTTPEEDADLAEEGPMRRVSKLATPPARDARVVTATTTTNAVDGLGGVLVLNGDGHGGGESIDGIENAIGLSDLLGAGIGTKLLGGESKSTTLRYTRRALLDGLNVINGNGVDTDDVLGAGTKLDALSTRARSINGLPASKEAMEAVSQTSPDAPKAGDVESTSTKTFSLLSLDNNAGLLGDTLHTFQSDRAANADVNNLAGLIGDTDVLAHSITQTNHRDGTVTRTMASRVANVNALTNVLGEADQNISATDAKQRNVDDLAGVGAGAAILPSAISSTTLKDGSQAVESEQGLAQVDLLGNVAGQAHQRVDRQRRGLLDALSLLGKQQPQQDALKKPKPEIKQSEIPQLINGMHPLAGAVTTTDVQSINGASLNTDFNLMGSSGVVSSNGVDTATGNTNDLGLGGGIHALGSTTKTTTTTMPLQ